MKTSKEFKVTVLIIIIIVVFLFIPIFPKGEPVYYNQNCGINPKAGCPTGYLTSHESIIDSIKR